LKLIGRRKRMILYRNTSKLLILDNVLNYDEFSKFLIPGIPSPVALVWGWRTVPQIVSKTNIMRVTWHVMYYLLLPYCSMESGRDHRTKQAHIWMKIGGLAVMKQGKGEVCSAYVSIASTYLWSMETFDSRLAGSHIQAFHMDILARSNCNPTSPICSVTLKMDSILKQQSQSSKVRTLPDFDPIPFLWEVVQTSTLQTSTWNVLFLTWKSLILLTPCLCLSVFSLLHHDPIATIFGTVRSYYDMCIK
jgi:hypothetical protein